MKLSWLDKKFWISVIVLPLALTACIQQSPPNSDFEVADENNNTVTTQAIPTNGLKGEYYNNVDFTGTLKTRYDANVNRTWNANAPISGIQPTTYSVRWTGQVMPAFSQTYTFFVTSSDGARLMVNGQVLVNDWVDGSSRVRSGTVALQANTKYDIRLEYYRNATNPASVKLEWQSSSRGRQVVPQASLFSTGSNLTRGIDITRSALTSLGLDINTNLARAFLQNELLLSAPDSSDSNAIIQARISPSNQIINLMRYKYTGSNLSIDNLKTKKSVIISNFRSYFNSDNTLVESRIDELVNSLASIYSLSGEISTSMTKISGILRPLGVELNSSCTKCDSERLNFLNQIRLIVAGGGMTTFIAVFPPSAPAGWWGAGASNFVYKYLPSPMPSQDENDKYINPTEKKWIDCVKGNCPARLIGELVIPNAPVGKASEEVSLAGSFANSQNSSEELEYTATVTSQGAAFFKIVSGATGKVKPAQFADVQIRVTCPSNFAVIFQGTLTINSNDRTRPTVTLPLTVQCGQSPKISVTPNPLELVAALNSSTTGKLTVSNTGDAPLTVSRIEASQGWVTNISPPNFTVAPGSSRSVDVTGTCDGTVGAKPSATVTILSNTVNAVNQVSLSCKDFYNETSRYTYLTIQVPDVPCIYATDSSGTTGGYFDVHYKFFAKPGYLSSPIEAYGYGGASPTFGSGTSTNPIRDCPGKAERMEIAKSYLIKTITDEIKPDIAHLEKYFSTNLNALANTPLSVIIRDNIGRNSDGTISAYYNPDEILIFDR